MPYDVAAARMCSCPFQPGQELVMPYDAAAARMWQDLGVKFQARFKSESKWFSDDGYGWDFDTDNMAYRRAPEPTVEPQK